MLNPYWAAEAPKKEDSMKLETMKLTELVSDPNNARKHDDKNLEAIKGSLTQFGQRKPIVIGAGNVVIAGNGTLAAAKSLGWSEIEVVRVPEDWTPDQAKAFALADNRTAELATWDEQVLAAQVLELSEAGITVAEFGFEAIEPELTEPDVEEDITPEPPTEPISKIGDIWKLGNHRVMCGSSTEHKTVSALMAGNKADMVFTDPPYNTGMSAKNNAGSTWLNHMFDDDYTDQEWSEFMKDFTLTLNQFTKQDSALYVCFAWKRNHELVPYLTDKFKLSNIIIWDKVVHGLGSDYQYTYEIINVCKKGKPEIDSHQGTDREYQDVWRIQRIMGRNDDHATAKPLELCARAIRHASKQGQIVLDIFGGSGSTLIAAEQTGRTCYMMELDPKYVDVIVKRWENLTGQKAELL
jgi:DNA modification methylase